MIALVSDDILLDSLVLKGGNAINLIHNLSSRGSIDLDYSMADDFSQEELSVIRNRIETSLKSTFQENGYEIFDYKFYEKPKKVKPEVRHFWGGYCVEFKILEKQRFEQFKSIDEKRRNAIVVGKGNSSKYTIEISKYEFVKHKSLYEIEGYTMFAYTPEMIVCEKIRALCQQVPEYKKIVQSFTSKSRARDFFDIYTLIEYFNIDLKTEENIDLLEQMFNVKKVPYDYMNKIVDSKELHKASFPSLKDTVKSGEELKEFDYYFDYVIGLLKEINLY